MTREAGPVVRRGGLGAALAAGGLHAALLAGALLAPGAAPGRWADPGAGIFLALWIAWSAVEAGLARPARAGERLSRRDRLDAALTGAALLAGAVMGLRRAPELALGAVWLAPAAAGLAAGVALRVAAVRRLGASFLTGAEGSAGAPLVTRGVYGRIRHPSETGLLLASASGAVLVRSGVFLALWVVAILPLAVIRARREDGVLAGAHGAAHAVWRRAAGMFLPRPRARGHLEERGGRDDGGLTPPPRPLPPPRPGRRGHTS